MQIADAIAVEDREAEAFRDALGLRRIGASETDHFERRALAKRDDTGAGARGTSNFGHGEILSRFRLVSDPARGRLSLGCGRQEPAEAGRFRGRRLPRRAWAGCGRAGLHACEGRAPGHVETEATDRLRLA